MRHLNLTKTGYIIGIISVLFFVVCSFWGLLFTSASLKELHLMLLQLAYPGFAFTVVGYTIGLIEAFAYGWFFGAFFAWLHDKICLPKDNK